MERHVCRKDSTISRFTMRVLVTQIESCERKAFEIRGIVYLVCTTANGNTPRAMRYIDIFLVSADFRVLDALCHFAMLISQASVPKLRYPSFKLQAH